MKQTIAMLYAHIMKFLIRALEWYEESRLARALLAITKPAALRYDDILRDIQKATRKVAEVAVASSQAEQRDMHEELLELTAGVEIIQKSMSMGYDAHADTHEQLRILTAMVQQLQKDMMSKITPPPNINVNIAEAQVQINLTVIASICQIDHQLILQASIFLRDKRRSMSRLRCKPFWVSPQLQTWNSTAKSSLLTIKATFRDRQHTQDFATNCIEQLNASQIPTLHILRSPDGPFDLTQVLQSLTYQALQLAESTSTAAALAPHIKHFQDATEAADYIPILTTILGCFDQAYIIIDADSLLPASAPACKALLQQLLHQLTAAGAQTVVKVLVAMSGPLAIEQQHREDWTTLRIPRISQKKGKRMAKTPLRMRQGLPIRPGPRGIAAT